jgi:hypothetical protein
MNVVELAGPGIAGDSIRVSRANELVQVVFFLDTGKARESGKPELL